MCNVLSCVYPGVQPGHRHNVRVGTIFYIGTAVPTELSADRIACEGEYDFNYLVYKGKGTFRFGIARQADGTWRLFVTFRGTWAADFEVVARCSESGGYCTFEGTDSLGVHTRVVLSFTTKWPVYNSITFEVERKGWSIPKLSFYPQ